jgi:plasmid stabilization system protein ParE
MNRVRFTQAARFEFETDIRCFFVYDYVVIYKAEQEGIVVLDIIHSSRDVQESYRDLQND